jgi:hypothetical protein
MAEETTLGTIIDIFRKYEDTKSISLSQYTKRCTINSRSYIQADIAEEPIVTDILKNIQNIYVGWILTALQMDTYVSDGRKVRDLLEVVGTESFTPNDPIIGLEDFGMPNSWKRSKSEERKSSTKQNTIELRDVKLPSGRIIKVTFDNDKGVKLDVDLLLQMFPRILPNNVCEQMLALNFTPELSKRWLQYKAGELHFWKDFVFQLDLLKKRQKALKSDRSGDLRSMLDHQKSALSRQLLKLFQVYPNMQNIANSVLVLDKASMSRYCSTNHIDFKKYATRQKFFNKSYSVILATIDPMYNRVEMYINGIDAKCEYTYKQMQDGGKSDKVALSDLMSSMNQGQGPRF